MPKLEVMQKSPTVKYPKRVSRSSIGQWVLYFVASIALLLVFSAYYAPDMMVALTNQVWALCGW
jgi:hypothetical protein